MNTKLIMTLLAGALLASCGKTTSTSVALPAEPITMQVYGKLPDGREAKIFTLTNKNGIIAKVTEYGAILVSVEIPDKNGVVADVTHGYDTLDGWLTNTSYFGSTVGRFGNRIKDGKFTLDGQAYTLATNNDPGGIPCHLHGGLKGFDKVLWTGKQVDGGVEFSYLSEDGEEGYPGKLPIRSTTTTNSSGKLKPPPMHQRSSTSYTIATGTSREIRMPQSMITCCNSKPIIISRPMPA